MPEVINLRILVPLAVLCLPATLIAAPPPRRLGKRLSTGERRRMLAKAAAGRARRRPGAAVLGAGDGWCDAPYDCRDAAARLFAGGRSLRHGAHPRHPFLGVPLPLHDPGR